MKTDEVFEECLIEMFKRVNLDFTYKEILKYGKQDLWYQLKTWTEKDNRDWESWVKEKIKKELKWNKKRIDYEVAMFSLNYSWKIKK